MGDTLPQLKLAAVPPARLSGPEIDNQEIPLPQRFYSVPGGPNAVYPRQIEVSSPGIRGELIPVSPRESLGESIRAAEEKHFGSMSGEVIVKKKSSPDFGARHVHTGQLMPKSQLKSKINKYTVYLERAYNLLTTGKEESIIEGYRTMAKVMEKAWNLPRIGHDLAYSLCDYARDNGYFNHMLQYFIQPNITEEVRFAVGNALQEMLSSCNRDFIVANHYLEPLVMTAKQFVGDIKSMSSKCKIKKERLRTVMSLMESLFKHSPETSLKLIDLGVLDMILGTIKKANGGTEVLRHAALALANLAMYSDQDCDQKIICKKVPNWLFLLASHQDDVTCYYACLAICVLSSKKEIESVVAKSGTLKLVEPFLTAHNPSSFVKSHYKLTQGRPKDWLKKMVHMLTANRKEAKALAAFHFCMEATVKKNQDCLHTLHDCGAVSALKEVASNPDDLATKFACSALKIIGEEVPYKLSQQVPQWSISDVQYWVTKIGFNSYAKEFQEQMVDGDLLLLLTDTELERDLKMVSGLHRKRFMRELDSLKMSTDYRTVDESNLDSFLISICPELSIYTYNLLQMGFDRDLLFKLTPDNMQSVCGMKNPVHKIKLADALQDCNGTDDVDLMMLSKEIDIFISYRRSTSSQLASLLKVMLQLRGYKVFIDVDRLCAGKFDASLLKNVQAANHFILILAEHSFDRLLDDDACDDWIHKEIQCAMRHNKNIVPIFDGEFRFPEEHRIPQDVRSITRFNGIRWVHDYQEACIDKLERFITGEVEKGDIDVLHNMSLMLPAPSPERQHSAPSGQESARMRRSSSAPLFDPEILRFKPTLDVVPPTPTIESDFSKRFRGVSASTVSLDRKLSESNIQELKSRTQYKL